MEISVSEGKVECVREVIEGAGVEYEELVSKTFGCNIFRLTEVDAAVVVDCMAAGAGSFTL